MTGIDRKTVAKYWKKYKYNMKQLQDASPETIPRIQEMITGKPKYDSSGRGPIKYSAEIDHRLDEILAAERLKDTLLGNQKQGLTSKQRFWCKNPINEHKQEKYVITLENISEVYSI